MKKIISFALLIAMLFVVSAFAEEDTFSIHSGVTFGMSVSEAMECEEANGFEIPEASPEGDFSDGFFIQGTIAGVDNASISYGFSDDALFRAHYDFGTTSKKFHSENIEPMRSDYAKISDALSSKYGATEYTFLTNKAYSFPSEYLGVVTSGFGERDRMSAKSWWNDKFIMDSYEQWFIPLDDGCGVFIDHCLYWWQSSADSTLYHELYYTYLDADTVSSFLEKEQQLTDDL